MSPSFADRPSLADFFRSLRFTFPAVVLARAKSQWWGARLLSYKPPPSPTKGGSKKKKQTTGKFVVEWIDASVSDVGRSDILTPLQPQFFTVKVSRVHSSTSSVD